MIARLNRPIRLLTLLLAAIQFAMPGVATVLDGQSAHEGGRMSAHIESGAQKSCKAPHSADCAVCRFLTQAVSRDRTAPAFITTSVGAIAPEAVKHFYLDAVRAGFNSRAPPSAQA